MVELACGKMNLSFSNHKGQSAQQSLNFSFSTSYYGGELSVRIRGGGNSGGYRKLEFYLDGDKAHEPAIFLNGSFDFIEKIRAGPGAHSLKIISSGTQLYQTEFEVPGRQFPFELLLILLFSFGISLLLRSPWREPMLFAISFAVVLSFGLIYQFVLSNNFGLPSWLMPGIYGGIELILWESRKRR